MWKKTDKWRPARVGTASGGGGVQDSETGIMGFAKSQFPHREKIASDLAARVGVMVPKVVLDRVDGGATLHAISLSHGKESVDLPLLRDRLAERFNSPEVQDALKRASGLLPFHAWLATRDLKDGHLMVAPGPQGAYNIAAVDFAYSLEWQEPDGGLVQPPVFPSLAANIDKNIVARVVGTIEAVTDREIREVIDALPPELTGVDEKERLANGLITRRGKIREVMQRQGWLP